MCELGLGGSAYLCLQKPRPVDLSRTWANFIFLFITRWFVLNFCFKKINRQHDSDKQPSFTWLEGCRKFKRRVFYPINSSSTCFSPKTPKKHPTHLDKPIHDPKQLKKLLKIGFNLKPKHFPSLNLPYQARWRTKKDLG